MFHKNKRLCWITLPLLLGSGSGMAQQSFPPAQIKKGAEVYASHCESCHGVRMQGPQWGIDLATFPRDNPRRFTESVTNGTKLMPPWGDVIKPDDIQALWAYVVAGEPGNK